MRTVLVTGAGTGFGDEAAMRLAEKGFDVIAAVEIYPQVELLENQAKERSVKMRIEKLDVQSEGDRRKALDWNVEILVNSAGMLEGGAVVDIPGETMRHEFEVNVDPFTGIYSASKHAIEAVAQTMKAELQEYNIEVATVNPGPFLTGFNDRDFDTWKSWTDEPSERLFDYSKLAFPRGQFDPEPVYATLTTVAAGEVDTFRNLEPKSMIQETKQNIEKPCSMRTTEGLGTRHEQVQQCYDMEPEQRAN